jgi:hypothetical protein
VKRRAFIMLLGGAGVASGWSFLASAQTARISRVGLADFASENDTGRRPPHGIPRGDG